MSASRAVCAVVVCSVLAPTEIGCRPETCDARGNSTTVSGVVSYAIAAAAGSTVSDSVTIDDYVTTCTYDAEEFPVTVGSCELWVTLQQGAEPPSRNFPGNPSAWAAVEAGQACELRLSGGTAAVTIDSGTVEFADSTTGVFLSGTVVSWTNGHGGTGALEWQFQGSGWPR